jgi:hypothetical protein
VTFSHVYGAFNAEGSVNEWFRKYITANGTPAWMPSARVVYDRQEGPLFVGHSGHAFSVEHLGSEPIMHYQGRNTIGGSAGHMRQGLAEVNCWISKSSAGTEYPMRLRQMGDMVTRTFASGLAVPLLNLYTGVNAPSSIGAIVRVSEAEYVPGVPDPNPDVLRRRHLVRYIWEERA